MPVWDSPIVSTSEASVPLPVTVSPVINPGKASGVAVP